MSDQPKPAAGGDGGSPMTCGSCQASQQSTRAKSVICHLCIYAERDPVSPWVNGAISCSIDGKPIESHVMATVPTCPMGKHPDAAGLVRWLGILWFGVPAPMRWVLRSRLTGPLPGCGCTVWGKTRWLRLKAWYTQRWVSPRGGTTPQTPILSPIDRSRA